ncbi:MAG: Uncharacterised protein [Synechococcus sp. MIT S9220]|nr:MAG: Uncharacterised protein [Synechococcus sp. MIT S9220]
MLARHKQGDGRLFGRCEELREDRFDKRHADQTPVAPGQSQDQGAWNQKQRRQHHHQCPQSVRGHHHPSFRPAVNPHPRHAAQDHRRQCVRHKDSRGQKGDDFGAGTDIEAVIGGHLRKNAVLLGGQQQVLIDQKDHQHDVELVRQLREDLADPEFAEVAQAQHSLEPAASLRIVASG